MLSLQFDQPRRTASICLRAAAGFTLIELLVSVAVLGILAAVAAPNMGQFFTGRKVEDVARRLGDDLNLARNEAVKRNAPLLVCADASVSTCTSTPLATDWAKGWRVCYDAAGSGSCAAGTAADPNPVRTQPAISAQVAMTGPAARLQFNPSGSMTSAVSPAAFSASAVARGKTSFTISAAPSGAISVRKVVP